jgi:hypothetical protein
VSEVSYQTFLSDIGRLGAERFVPLPPNALSTRRKDADRTVTIRISKAQDRWLDHVEAITGKGIDADAIVRALIDLAGELDVDWAMLAGGPSVRSAIADAVRVRQATAGS